MNELTAAEQLAYATVLIKCEYADGSTGTGTGFFYRFMEGTTLGNHVPVVITNKHVVKGASVGKLLFTLADQDGNPVDTDHFEMAIEGFEQRWVMHPDPDVDLCALAIAPFAVIAAGLGKSLFYVGLSNSILPTQKNFDDFSGLEEILMVGYPNGLWDKTNNKPIFRRGSTATHLKFDYCGKKEFLIDAACFPGSSGSPVFIYNDGMYTDRKGNTFHGRTRVILLGVLYAGPQHTASGAIEVMDVPTVARPVAISRIPNNLGIIIKSERILEIENVFKGLVDPKIS